jgi:NADPH2:quinone reductase
MLHYFFSDVGIHAFFRFEQDLRMIKRKGTIVSYGNASGPVENVRLLQLTEKNIKVLRPT